MGNCQLMIDEYDPTTGSYYAELMKIHFHHECVIGIGGFGKVWKVVLLSTGQTFALKEMRKSRIIAKRNVGSILKERKLLAAIKHPFIVNMNFAFQDRSSLYLVMDLMTGGDLRYHFGQNFRFSEEQAKFIAACIITGLEYLHTHSIIHRDIKPENLVFDDRGYLRITDFGAASVLGQDNSEDTSGTPGYMAPEVMCQKAHGQAVDYFALGVILYELMLGKKLFNGKSSKEIRDEVLTRRLQLRRGDVPEGWSLEGTDFINKLLERKPQDRLGFHGPKEVKNHAWYRGFPWQKLMEKSLPAPFRPQQGDNFDKKYIDYMRLAGSVYRDESREPQRRDLFAGYYYDCRFKQKVIPSANLSDLVRTI